MYTCDFPSIVCPALRQRFRLIIGSFYVNFENRPNVSLFATHESQN